MGEITHLESIKGLWKGLDIVLIMLFLFVVGTVTIFSPSLVITVGGFLLLFNRLKMGRITLMQAIISCVVLALAGSVLSWLTSAHVPDLSWRYFFNNSWGMMIVAGVFCMLAGWYIYKTVEREISEFRQRNVAPGKVLFWHVLFIFLLTISLNLVLSASVNLTAKLLGACYFPTLPDLSQLWLDGQKMDIQKAILRTEDFGCGWSLSYQSSQQGVSEIDSPTATQMYSRSIYFRYFNHESKVTAYSDIDHEVWIEPELANLPEFTRKPDNIDLATKTPIDLPSINLTPPPDLMKVSCLGYNKDKFATYCQVFIVRGSVVSRLVFESSNLPRDEYWALFTKVIQNTDKRIQAYQRELELPIH